MIAGLFIRNYKVYENYNFFPFLEKGFEKFNLFIGNNGAGKSSVLEALDTFFNGRPFLMTNTARVKNSNIAPVFFICKENFDKILSPEEKDLLGLLDSGFRESEFSSRYASNPKIEEFDKFREKLISIPNSIDNYFFILGHEHSTRETTLITVQSIIEEYFESKEVQKEKLHQFLNTLSRKIKAYYKYIYIPVETSITDFLKLEAEGMQSLMDKDLKVEISKILNTKFKTKGKGETRTTERNVEILNYINEKIAEYVESIEKSIQTIDEKYHFNRELRSKTVGANDLAEVIIEAYFSKRRLQLEDKDIKTLSAGERKKALIDIAYAFLKQNSNTQREVILAVDEPESSLHVSMCYQQYERLQEISDQFGKQVFITTHWYGGLPIINSGRLYHVQKRLGQSPSSSIFSLENYFEERKNHPHDVYLKSFFDLTASLISAIRSYPTNWILVEGNTDKRYLKHYLPSGIDVKILPVGGCTIIKKIYEYLFLPLKNTDEDRSFKGKIFCLIDTDKQGIKLDFDSSTKNGILAIRRLQVDNNEVKLLKIEDNLNTESELEEVLNPSRFYKAFENLIEKFGSTYQIEEGGESIKDIFNCYEFEPSSIHSFIFGTNTIFKTKVLGRSLAKDLTNFHSFFDAHKDEICDEYLSIESEDKLPWVEKIVEFLSSK